MEGGGPIEKNKIMILYIDIEIIREKIRVLERMNREFIINKESYSKEIK